MAVCRILIVDDEPPARSKLTTFLKGEPDVEIIGEAGDGQEAVEAIEKLKPDLVFLDIQMPGMTGFEVIESIGVDEMPNTVFVTAYDQYAIKAFEVQALDYLLKPYDYERFKKALDRARQQLTEAPDRVHEKIDQLLSEISVQRGYLERLMVKDGGRIFFLKVDDISHITAEEKYVCLHIGKTKHLIRQTMNYLEKRLDPQKFVRIHRSQLVNIDFIKELQPWSHGDHLLIMQDGARLTLSRRYKDNLLGLFGSE